MSKTSKHQEIVYEVRQNPAYVPGRVSSFTIWEKNTSTIIAQELKPKIWAPCTPSLNLREEHSTNPLSLLTPLYVDDTHNLSWLRTLLDALFVHLSNSIAILLI